MRPYISHDGEEEEAVIIHPAIHRGLCVHVTHVGKEPIEVKELPLWVEEVMTFLWLQVRIRGMEILRRTSRLRVPVSLSETVSLLRMWTQQRCPGTAAVKFSSSKWHAIIMKEGKAKSIWSIWNCPRPPVSSWSFSKATLKRWYSREDTMTLQRQVQRHKKFPYINSNCLCDLAPVSH